MQKDIIYIDVDDDITAIIGKVKAAKHKIVAVVPPKRIGVLQSAVNLRLLVRSAAQHDKRLVIITGNSALMALAANVKVPIAKTLQSKPEIPEIPALDIDDGDDIIDGSKLPIGELQKTSDRKKHPHKDTGKDTDDAVDEISSEDEAEPSKTMGITTPVDTDKKKSKLSSGVKVPNFNTFRKKLILGIGGAIVLVSFLVWAIVFAPTATVTISAKTSTVSVDSKASFADTAKTDFAAGTIQSFTADIKKDVSATFVATGKKDVGEKAKGSAVFKNCEDDTAPVTIAAGTQLTAAGMTFTTDADVIVPKATGSFLTGCTSTISTAVGITATAIGTEYNLTSGSIFSVSGHPSSGPTYLRASATTDVAGGTKKQVTVVSRADIDKATEDLSKQTDDMKNQLVARLGAGVIAVPDTYRADVGAVVSTPAVDTESADGKAKLTGSVIYKMAGVKRDSVSTYLDGFFAKQIGSDKTRRAYENGSGAATLVEVIASENGFSASVVTTGRIGPQINDNEVKEIVKGKRYGDIQAALEAIQGVDEVDTKFAPFWVSSVPNDPKRINVVFKLSNGTK